MLAAIPPAYVAPFERAWRNRELIRAVVRREFISRFRGSFLGPAWAVLSPLVMLLTYTTLFSITVPQLSAGMSVTDYASGIFIGLIVFNLFSELGYRAPVLLHEHVNFVKRSIFPSETIAWTATIRAFTYAGVAFGVYVVFRLATAGSVPLTILLTPFLVVPFFLFILGVVWFLMALGAFTRDVAHIMASIIPVLMFATPIFYRLDQIAAMSSTTAMLLRLNIVGDYIEMLRAVALDGYVPNILGYFVVAAASYAVFLGGYKFFMRYKSVIVDVI
ncbi:ABC transporter permease [Methylocystis parvus]|uniref:ABC transporter n=1 Tax=Methylocystis parvus TaxID=134 RepID=A0A6B8M358_9HYPH|nr:ABC transporter permease [Methylocystis parvus]QGM98284.1 ABC transporter [Methylocystis parvus]WBK01390.1 ABC transporter permease [Methylocystis parvus OBBP]